MFTESASGAPSGNRLYSCLSGIANCTITHSSP